MVKENEIQIGDWLRSRYVDNSGALVVKDFRVDQLIRDYTLEMVVYSDLGSMGYASHIEPIPITPEILEKNGWVKFQVFYRLKIDKEQYMEYYPHKGRLERIYDHKDGWHEVVFTVIGLHYVHLIQHALQLCGIEKEIVI